MQKLGLDEPDHNPFTDPLPASAAEPRPPQVQVSGASLTQVFPWFATVTGEGTAIMKSLLVHLQESTSFFTRKKTMSVPPKKITGIIDGMKHVYFSKVTNQCCLLTACYRVFPGWCACEHRPWTCRFGRWKRHTSLATSSAR